MPEARYADRLSTWLKQQLGARGLVASSPAPNLPEAPLPADLAEKLDQLKRIVPESSLSLALPLRHETADEPEACRLLKRHEGVPPNTLATLCPVTPTDLYELIIAGQSSGFHVSGTAAERGGLPALSISLDKLDKVDVACARDGRVAFQAGTDWHKLTSTAAAHGLAAPKTLTGLFPIPADAAEAGFLVCHNKEDIRGITTSYEVTLPPAGTKWLERLWLFPNEDKAWRAFEKICRDDEVVFAQVVSATDLHLANKAGLIDLPKRNLLKHQYTGLRLVFSGPLFSALCAEFAASWPLERAGSFQWNGRALPSSAQITNCLLASGATMASISIPTSFSEIDGCKQAIADALREASLQHSPAAKFAPLITCGAVHTRGRLTMTVSVIVPRDYMAPLEQWQAIFDAGSDAAGLSTAPGTTESPAITEESPEWQAIRDALLDDEGRLRPVPGEASQDNRSLASNHG